MSQAMIHGAVGIAQGSSFLDTLTRLASTMAAEIRVRRDLHVLQNLDERQLHDIGLGSGELDHAVRHGRPRTDARRQAAAASGPLMPASWTEWR